MTAAFTSIFPSLSPSCSSSSLHAGGTSAASTARSSSSRTPSPSTQHLARATTSSSKTATPAPLARRCVYVPNFVPTVATPHISPCPSPSRKRRAAGIARATAQETTAQATTAQETTAQETTAQGSSACLRAGHRLPRPPHRHPPTATTTGATARVPEHHPARERAAAHGPGRAHRHPHGAMRTSTEVGATESMCIKIGHVFAAILSFAHTHSQHSQASLALLRCRQKKNITYWDGLKETTKNLSQGRVLHATRGPQTHRHHFTPPLPPQRHQTSVSRT